MLYAKERAFVVGLATTYACIGRRVRKANGGFTLTSELLYDQRTSLTKQLEIRVYTLFADTTLCRALAFCNILSLQL